LADPNLRFIEGREIVEDLSLLGSDIMHPTIHGHARMGELLAWRIVPLLAAKE
jgi:hypothetical protein